MNPPILLTGSEGMSLKADYEQALLEMLLRKRLKQLRVQHQPPVKKRCPTCSTVLRNPARTYCSKRCVCAAMTQRIMSPEYAAEREKEQQAQWIELHCKTCNKSLGLRKPGSVTYCSRACAGNDPDIRASKSAKRKKLWADPEYRQRMTEYAIARNADLANGFVENH